MFAASPKSIKFIQYLTLFIAVLGVFHFEFNLQNYLILLISYILYSGVGVGMMLHRYFTHKTFEFKSNFVKWFCTWFALMAGRGGIIGWVYIHRLHHKNSDTVDDPHYSSLTVKGMFFPDYSKFSQNVNLRVIRDLLTTENIKIDKYYNLLILGWIVLLLLISPSLFYFGWVLPVALTHFFFNSFLYIGHKFGYRNYHTKDSSTNFWPYAIFLLGEGWHNNHHNDPGKWNLQVKEWEFDLISIFIRLVKK